MKTIAGVFVLVRSISYSKLILNEFQLQIIAYGSGDRLTDLPPMIMEGSTLFDLTKNYVQKELPITLTYLTYNSPDFDDILLRRIFNIFSINQAESSLPKITNPFNDIYRKLNGWWNTSQSFLWNTLFYSMCSQLYSREVGRKKGLDIIFESETPSRS